MKRTIFKGMALLFCVSVVFANTASAEKVLVVVDNYYQLSTGEAAVNQYVADLRAEGNTVYTVTNYYDGLHYYSPSLQAKDLHSIIKNYYDLYAINGAVLVGNMPCALIFDPVSGGTYVNDYFFMDMTENAPYTHDNAWETGLPDDYTYVTYHPEYCDNQVEIWVSRITYQNIITSELKDANGIQWTPDGLMGQYFGRVHQRMTQKETVPQRYMAMGMGSFPSDDNENVLGFDVLKTKGYNGWNLGSQIDGSVNALTDLPSNWQAQLQAGPYGNQTAQIGTLANGVPVLIDDSRTYSGISNDNLGFEWAGIYEHSNYNVNCFAGFTSYFTSTMDLLAQNYYNGTYQHHRAYTGMKDDGGHSKARFIMSKSCTTHDFCYPDCIGLMYGMAGNALISVGSTSVVLNTDPDIGQMISKLTSDDTKSFGAAFKEASQEIRTDQCTYVMIGAGTLRAKPPKGYATPQIHATFSPSAAIAQYDGAGNFTGSTATLTFTSNSVYGGSYNAASTVYKWYDNNRNYIMQTGASVPMVLPIAGNVVKINNQNFSGNIMIQAYQAGYISGYITTTSTTLLGARVYPTIINITPATAIVQVYKTQKFTAVVVDQNGKPLNPQPPKLTWSTGVTGTVDQTGLFTASYYPVTGSVGVQMPSLALNNSGGSMTVVGNQFINCGGSNIDVFQTDYLFSGGSASSTSTAITLTGVTNPAPMAVYQSDRWGVFTYTLNNLVANSSYKIRLHFAEIYFNAANKRKFHVNINGARVLTDYDVYAQAGGQYKAKVQEFTATSNASGVITINFLKGSLDNPKCNGIEALKIADYQVNCGGSAASPFDMDRYYSGGNTSSTTQTITTTGVTNPAPAAVYQSDRWLNGTFSYTFGGLFASRSYKIRLHFAEIYFNAANKRKFHVNVNGVRKLTDYDVYAKAGGQYKAKVEELIVNADGSGQIKIDFLKGTLDNPKCNGIEVLLN
jgi:hypothetical protein